MSDTESEWFREWFNTPYYHLLYRNRDEKEASGFITRLTSRLKIPPGSALLDLGCGRGRHSIQLAKLGYKITGIDLSPASIAEAKSLSDDPSTEFIIHDMRKPFRSSYYDGVLSLFSSFGYFRNESENRQAFHNAAVALRNDGLLVIDFMNTPAVLNNLVPAETIHRGEVEFHIQRYTDNGLIVKDITVADNDQRFYFTEQVRAYTLDDFIVFCHEESLEPVCVFGDYDLNNFEPENSDRLILVARRNQDK